MDVTFIMLIVSAIIALVLFFYIKKNNTKNSLTNVFLINLILVLIWIIPLIFQILFANRFNIDPILFDYFAYIGICFLPVSVFFTGLIFANTKIRISRKHLLLFVVPIISLIMVWTNDYHHLFYKNYSIDMSNTIHGAYFYIYTIYNLILYIFGLTYLLKYSIKNSGFFSKQAILFTIAILIPLISNFLGTFGIINMSVYMTPILFTITLLLCAIAIFRFGFLKVTPIAMQRVVDRMSDSFLVINEDGMITDFNDTFLKTFDLKAENVRNINFVKFVYSQNLDGVDESSILSILEKCKTTDQTILIKREMSIRNSYFNVEASGIFSNNVFLGTLILLKDVTQHMQDMKTIQNNQEMLMERERLASLGQLIGGIAHNLKTPIMSIAGASEGLNDLIKEYDMSIGDPDVTNDDHHAIAKDMSSWTQKIKEYTEYMSDVITTVKGQAVTLSEEDKIAFDLDELVKRVNILMKHELKNALINLNVSIQTDNKLELHGNIVSLVQVINNMISNSIQAYNGKTGKDIDLTISKKNNDLIISVQDYADGLPQEVQDKLFKEMITTKGKNGTGLGLFMSYSTIRAHFNGNITFETEINKGTKFNIILPIE